MCHLLITRGQRRIARVEGPGMVILEGDALCRQALLRAVAVTAGRASPEIIHESAGEDLAGEEMAPPTIAEARAQGRLILVAEDDGINQKVILQQLGLLGYAAEVAGNGTEALQLWREGNYDLLLTESAHAGNGRLHAGRDHSRGRGGTAAHAHSRSNRQRPAG